MPKNLRCYLDFTCDLERVINCLMNGNVKSAVIFFDHAALIYKEQIIPILDTKYFPKELQKLWKNILKSKIAINKKEQKLIADKILTLSTILFKRTYYYAFN